MVGSSLKWLESLQEEESVMWRQTHGATPCDDTVRDRSDAATSRGTWGTVGHHEQLGKGKGKFCPKVQMKQYSANTLIFELLASRTVRDTFLLF